MGMLERIKKKQLEGFREFIVNLETTSLEARAQIFTSGLLEDPLYMSWVLKNIRTFDDFMKLPGDEIERVLTSQEGVIGVFVKALENRDEAGKVLEGTVPKLMSKIRDEAEYVGEVSPEQRIAARSHVMKTARKLQLSEAIQGFRWQLPPMEIFYPKSFKDGLIELFFESGVIAAKGHVEKNQRVGPWVHYYDNGRILAQGDYLNGLKEGSWIFYFSSGKERARGRYLADQRHGTWTEWDREGNSTEVTYAEGLRRKS